MKIKVILVMNGKQHWMSQMAELHVECIHGSSRPTQLRRQWKSRD